MASSQNTQVTFATLPREVRDNIYRQMLAEPKTIDAQIRGLPEDWRTLRPMLHACRKSPRHAAEAIDAHFESNTFRIGADNDFGFLNRPAYYLHGRGFVPMKMHVKFLEIGLALSTSCNEALRQCFRGLLALPVLRRVTVRVNLLGDSLARRYNMPTEAVVDEDHLAELDIILTVATGSYQALKQRLGAGLRFDSRHARLRDNLAAWEERVDGATVEETSGVDSRS